MFLKNRYGTTKGRTMSGGNKQMEFIFKEDYSSLDLATRDVLLSYIIDAEEERDVAVIDTPQCVHLDTSTE